MALTKITGSGISDVAAAVEGASDSNTFTDAESSKLAGVASSANNYVHPNHSGDVVSAADGAMTIQTDAVDIAMLSATGTPGSTTFLRGDNAWATAGSTSASDLTSGTLPDARFPATLPTASAANLTAIPAANITGTLPAISGANLTGINSVPSGVIAMWHGASSAIPSGWVICDGNNSTPNLTDKFIKSTATAGGTGGSATTGATTLTTAQMPAHTHSRTPYTPGSAAAYAASGYNSFFDAASATTSSTGGGGSHTHPQSEPVYFALIFIMKT